MCQGATNCFMVQCRTLAYISSPFLMRLPADVASASLQLLFPSSMLLDIPLTEDVVATMCALHARRFLSRLGTTTCPNRSSRRLALPPRTATSRPPYLSSTANSAPWSPSRSPTSCSELITQGALSVSRKVSDSKARSCCGPNNKCAQADEVQCFSPRAEKKDRLHIAGHNSCKNLTPSSSSLLVLRLDLLEVPR